MPIRHARALARVLAKMPVRIGAGELIVGYHPESTPPVDAPSRPTLVPSQDPLRLPRERAALQAGLFTSAAKTGHLTPDYPLLLSIGYGGIRDRVHAARRQASGAAASELDAMSIAVSAATAFVRRYARRARTLAQRADSSARAGELHTISECCEHVATQAPRCLREALQLLWFTFLIQCIEEGESTAAFALGRFDQYLFPFWQADREAGRSVEELTELVACFWVKLNEFAGLQVLNLTIGGSDGSGGDAANELSYVCLDLAREFRSPVPSLTVRWHAASAPDFLRRAVELAADGTGHPALYGEPAMVKSMRHAGVAPEDAIDVVPGGCVELGVQGCCYPWVGNFFNLPKCLELALHNGVDPRTGVQIGPQTGSVAALDTFGQVLDAYRCQVDALLELMAHSDNTTDQLAGSCNPYPFLSSIVQDCIARGRDIAAGGARYNFTEVQGVGIAHVVDSLLNLRRFVYEQRAIGLDTLVSALAADFAAAEPLQRRLAGAVPAYGQHTDATAEMARAVVHHFYDSVERFSGPRGGRFRPGLLVWTLYDHWADSVGALPDGRRRGDALVSSIGPRDGVVAGSPTSVVQDAMAFDHFRCVGGLTMNLRFDASVTRTGHGLQALERLIDVYFREGGLQLQINVVDDAVLREAQARPEKHTDLTVRVSGFSARFVTLSRRMQDEIIARAQLAVHDSG